MTKIIHFSDSHAGGPAEDLLAYLDKRWVGVFNFKFRRQFQHNQTKLQKAVDYILQTKPDVAICTGDLTSTGQPGEFAIARKILQPLRDSKIPLIFVPGNHDYYVHRTKCVTAMKEMISFLTKNAYQFENMPLSLNYGEIDFIIINESWPTSLISSCGYLKKDSLNFIKNFCAKPKKRPRIIVGHYPLIEDYPIKRIRHRLWGQKEVVKLLQENIIDISLCGHIHLPYTKLDANGRGEICAGSVTRNDVISELIFNKSNNTFSQRHLYCGKDF